MSTRRKPAVLEQTGLTVAQVEEMYQVMAIANYEDRFVIPDQRTANTPKTRLTCAAAAASRLAMGAPMAQRDSLFGGSKPRTIPIKSMFRSTP
jgi:nitrate reductase beta subunit